MLYGEKLGASCEQIGRVFRQLVSPIWQPTTVVCLWILFSIRLSRLSYARIVEVLNIIYALGFAVDE